MNKKSSAQIAADLGMRERSVKKLIRLEGERKKSVSAAPAEEPDIPAQPIPIKKSIVLASVALIMIMGFAVYANSLYGKFVYDDAGLIIQNKFVKGCPTAILKVFVSDGALFAGKKTAFYRPLQLVTYAIDYSIWKLNAVGYHLTNILLHILVALCIYWLIAILFSDNILSVLAAVFFVVHPIHTTVVSYISTRAESLYLLFMLISFIFYIKYSKARSVMYYLIMMSCYSLALLSKENALILPALILLYHYTFREKIRPGGFISISAFALIYLLLRMTVLKHLMPGAASNSTLFQRIPGFFDALTTYMRLMFLPFDLHIEYGTPLFYFTDPKVICGLLILAAMIFCVFKTMKTSRLIFFSLSWFIIALIPVSNLYPLNAYMSENWLYLPSIGFFIVLAGLLRELCKNEKFRIPAFVLTAGLLVFYSYLTIRQNETWREPIPFYERTLKYAPDSPRIYNNLGLAYYDIGKKEEAIAMYRKSLELNPALVEAYNNLGTAYYDIGKKEESIAMYKKAIELKPNYDDPYYNLANKYYEIGRKEDAVVMYEKVIEINPYNSMAYNNLANKYDELGRREEAVAMYKKAIEINPNYSIAYNNLASTYDNMGKKEDAIIMFKKAIELNPNYAEAYNNLASLYYKTGKKDDAVAMCKKTIEIDPNYVKAYNGLGLAYYGMEKNEEAIAMYKKAIELNPDYTDAYNNLGAAYFAAGMPEDAAYAFKKALEINPNQADARRNLEAISAGSKKQVPSSSKP